MKKQNEMIFWVRKIFMQLLLQTTKTFLSVHTQYTNIYICLQIYMY